MRRWNVVVALASAGFGATILWLSRNMPMSVEYGIPGDAYWPTIIAWLFILLGVLQVVEVVGFPSRFADLRVDLSSRPVRFAYIGAVLGILYAVALDVVGFVPSTLVFVPATMALMRERRAWITALVAVAVVGVIYYFFVHVFRSPLPPGSLFE